MANQFKLAAIKAAIVLVPSYLAAYLTDKMVYVVPTLAAAGFFAANIDLVSKPIIRRLDEDGSEYEDHSDETDTEGESHHEEFAETPDHDT